MLFSVRASAVTRCACCLLLLASMAAQAQPETAPEQWHFDGEIYLWGAGFEGKTAAGAVDVPFDDIFDDLEFAFMGTLAASRDKWIAFANLNYLDLESGATVDIPFFGTTVKGQVNARMKGFITTLGGGYRLGKGSNSSLYAVAGARYFGLDLDLGVTIPMVFQGSVSESGDVWDGVVGVRGEFGLAEKWYVTYYGDVGTGDSDLTWQAMAGINYRFRRTALVLGYAHLEWDFGQDSIVKDLAISGPYAGLQFRFR